MKIKHNGNRIKVRVMNPDEKINMNTLWAIGNHDESEFNNLSWNYSMCVGEKVSEHPLRTYIEVISSWYVGLSRKA